MTPPHRICFKCSYEANIAQIVCPRCGGKMKSKSQIRVLGAVLTLISGFLVVFMSVIAVFMYNAVQQSDKPGATSKFTGSENDILIIIAIFGLVILFGIIGLITGLWQLIFGKRNLILVYSLLAIGAVLFIGGYIFRFYK